MPFVKGQSGNPGGRGSDKLWREAVLRAVKRREKGDDPQALEKLADRLVALGIEGDVSALREIGDRLDGKPAQAHTGPDGEALPLNFVMNIGSKTE